MLQALYIFFHSMLIKLFLHSKIETVCTNDYFDETFCRQEEGLTNVRSLFAEKPETCLFLFPYIASLIRTRVFTEMNVEIVTGLGVV